jgi:phospholipase C
MKAAWWVAGVALAVAACSSDQDDTCAGPCPQSAIRHLVVIVQENHTFDDHFGRYCTAPPGSNPTCNEGPACCEAAPAADPSGAPLGVLDDAALGGFDPNHDSACESEEIDGGKMDHFAVGATTASCSDPRNVAASDPSIVQPYWDLASKGALADRYFQPIVGASSANDMYMARAQYVFDDNHYGPEGAVGVNCTLGANSQMQYPDATIGDLLTAAGVPWTYYAGGYDAQAVATAQGTCAPRPADCTGALPLYPCTFDPSDVPFEYYASSRDDPAHIADDTRFLTDLDQGTLPAVSFVRAVGWKSEHAGQLSKLSIGIAWATSMIAAVEASRYRDSTLVILTYDEGGGYFDHVPPPPPSPVDGKPYGTRLPTMAIGPFAKQNFVSHVVMEHSSLVKFIEWNFLGGVTGQLGGRDTVVSDIGSLLDPSKTGVAVPEN